ncbi:MAG: sensor histidine kinase, partial [Acidimicrobiia bacterium]
SEAGRLARAASFVVAFLVPAMTVVGFRSVIRRRAERDRLEQELTRQKELTETKDRLIAGLSHQLRTPITGIYGFADLLLSQPDHELATEGIESIFRESGELRRMVDDILVAARITADNVGYRTQPTPATQVIDRALIHFHRLGARIKVDTQDALVQVDGARLEHALRNLVANAIRHGSEPIEVLGCARGDSYQVIVRDVGPGLGESPALEPFRPYFHDLETVTVRGSLGLGLSVARTLVEAMDGSIAYSRVNGATEFTVTVPLTKT